MFANKAEIEEAARLNNVDPDELRAAIEKGPDEDGRFSPFSGLKQLDNGLTKEDLEELDKQKLSPTGEPLTKPLSDFKAIDRTTRRGQITRYNQDTTAYNWTGNPTASGFWPELTFVACHRMKDLYGGNDNTPVIPFGSTIYLDRIVWLPDGEYHSQFMVQDTGLGPGKTAYWLDIYYGYDTASAMLYGNTVLTYNQITN